MARPHDLTALLPFPTRPESAPADSSRHANRSRSSERSRSAHDIASGWVSSRPRDDRSTSRTVAPAEPSPSAEVLQLDQLELTELVRHHAARGGAGRRRARTDVPDRTAHQGPAECRVRQSVWEGRATLADEHEAEAGTFGLGFGLGFASPRKGLVRTRPASDGTKGRDEATRRTSSSSDGAVSSPGFYLDLIGAVAVMALVLLAAILV